MMKTMTNMTKIRSTSFSPTKKTSLRTMNEKRLAKSRETGTWWLKQKEMEEHWQKIKKHRRVRNSTKISLNIKSVMNIFSESKEKREKKIKTEIIQQNEILLLSRFCEKVIKNKSHKIRDILSKEELDVSKKIISEIEQNRKSKKLNSNPKLWQFHHCLNLQKIELYTTNLKISCEGWIAIDDLEMKYLRGYKPKVVDDFSPILRMLVAKVIEELPEVIDVDKVCIRVNDKEVGEQKSRGLKGHTILSIRKLVTGMLMTSYDDLLTYCIYNTGYILDKIESNSWDPQTQIVFLGDSQSCQLNNYCSKVEEKCRKICKRLQLQNTYPSIRKDEFKLDSSPLDISILFMKCIHAPLIEKAFSYRVYEPQIRYQVGFKFWENRHIKWINDAYDKYRIQGVGGRNKKNECFVAYDPEMKVVMGLADCKVNMHLCDVQRIQEWIRKSIGRFGKYYNIKNKFSPFSTATLFKIK